MKSVLNHPEKINPWILEQFPINYQELLYVEPMFSPLYFLKKKSVKEYINHSDADFINFYRVLRDDDKLIPKLLKIKYEKRTFTRSYNLEVYKNELDWAFHEFILRNMSKNGLKEEFYIKKQYSSFKHVRKRIQNTYFLNSNYKNVIKAFNEKNAFIFINGPLSDDIFNKLPFSNAKILLRGFNDEEWKDVLYFWKKIQNNEENFWKNY